MNYQKINYCDSANGPGVRVSLWVSGCNHHCSECHNPNTWNPDSGKQFTDETTDELLRYLKPNYISGLTLSGGDPLFPSNRTVIEKIVEIVKLNYPEKTIWLWTGYLWEEINSLNLLKYIDVLIDGPYMKEKRNISLPYCGSENQRVIDVQKSLKENKVILYRNE